MNHRGIFKSQSAAPWYVIETEATRARRRLMLANAFERPGLMQSADRHLTLNSLELLRFGVMEAVELPLLDQQF